jgi:hypothetical protein
MRMNKKLATGAAAGVIVLAGGGIAFAYWTASGSGNGSASTSAGAATVSVAQTSTISNLNPGGTAQTISGSVTNTGSESAYITSVTVSIASVVKATSAPAGTCDASDYDLSDEVMTVGQDLDAGEAATFTGATIAFLNKATNQDACKGATVNLLYTAA